MKDKDKRILVVQLKRDEWSATQVATIVDNLTGGYFDETVKVIVTLTNEIVGKPIYDVSGELDDATREQVEKVLENIKSIDLR